MKHISALITELEMTNKTNAKIDALVEFFQHAPEKDKLWLIALFTGKRPRRPIKTTLLREWCLEQSNIPQWLFKESYSRVGDLGETMALVLPKNTEELEQPLSVWMDQLTEIRNKTDEEKKEFVLTAWKSLDQQERLIFNKLIGGSFRIGVSKKTMVNALAKYSDQDANHLMHSLIGNWDVNSITFDELISGEHINSDASKPYPFCLAYSLEKTWEELGNPADWQVEYKWDGIRGQVIKRNGEVFIWSRGEELVTAQFPEIVEQIQHSEYDFSIDGEILPLKQGKVLNFNDLQKRLNRKNVTAKLLEEVPVGLYVYDCMEFLGEDVREQPLSERRKLVEKIIDPITSQMIQPSQVIDFSTWEELQPIREDARKINSEGLMLKSKHSIYHVGRKKGDWWKWKVDPLTIDAVMIYAQRGSGRRSSYYTDYTFAVRTDDGLVTVAKAYSGLTDVEIKEVSRFVRNNEIEKFGPVRTVKPELVFEIAFEGIGYSKRHKSGVALRFPRILRWRKDKKVEEIDHIDEVKKLIQ